MGRLADPVIMLLVGVWATGVGYGRLPMPGAGPSGGVPGWFQRNARWMGPALVAIALVLVGDAVARGP